MAEKICPLWVGYLLSSPLRKLIQNPQTILSPFVRPGMTVVDLGCAMGFFSIPLGQMVGRGGKVVCVDIQEGMLTRLGKKVERKGLAPIFEFRRCNEKSFGFQAGEADFICTFAVVHEVPDPAMLFREAAMALKPRGQLLFAEPRGHVSDSTFQVELDAAMDAGFKIVSHPRIIKSHGVLLEKTQ